MTDHLPRIALLGLGTMGAGMARNILAAGLPLAVWNRSHDKAAPFADLGATVAPNPGAAVAGADLVVTMLFDAESVIEVMTAAEPGFAPGQIWVQTSTVGVEGALSLQGLADRLGLRFVDAPVLGTKKPAEDGTLVVLAAGAEEDLAVCVPLFEAIGSRTVPVGEAVDASRLKLVANAWVLAVLEGVAESLTLARGMGLDPELFLEAIRGGAMDAPYVQLKGAGHDRPRLHPGIHRRWRNQGREPDPGCRRCRGGADGRHGHRAAPAPCGRRSWSWRRGHVRHRARRAKALTRF